MKKIILSLCFFLTAATSFSQSNQDAIELDLGFEQNASGGQMPNNWVQWGTGYTIETDTLIKNSSKRSVRIEANTNKNAKSIGTLVYAISSSFSAKEIELRARMKLKHIKNGSAGLMVRLDGPSGMVLTYENTLDKNIQRTKKWSAYSLKARFPENVKTIYIGAMLSGDGQLWVDDFQILLDGKVIREAQVVKQEGFISFLPKESDRRSTIPKIILSQSNIADLDVLGKVWGFLKYYHPAVAGGKYDWDHELFRILSKVLEAKNSDKRNSVLNAWVTSLGSFNKRNFDDTKGLEVKILPDLSWIDPTVLGNELATSLNEVKLMERPNEHYYIRMVQGVGNPDFKNELSYNMMTYPDAGLQLLGLYRYWNIIHYFFPYKNLISENWNKVLTEYIPRFINASSELEYKLAALSIIARIHDTHANIWSMDEALKNYKGRNYGPMEITFVEKKAVVTDYFDTIICQKAGVKVGDIIESIDGKAVIEIIKEKQPLTPASNFPTQLRDMARDLMRTNQSKLDIEYSRGDKRTSTQIETVNQFHFKTKSQMEDTCFRLINNEIAYLYPGSIKNKYLSTIMAEVGKTKGLIIDFRCYPSDFIVFTLSEYILPEEKSFVKFSYGSITSPGLFTMTKELKVGNSNPGYYKGKIVIIINEMTQSSAEYHTMALRKAPNALVIGSTSAGADGNVSRFFLPGSISTMISGIGVYYPDGTETQRIGIIPDIEVKPTIKGIREGRDELLEKAIEIIN